MPPVIFNLIDGLRPDAITPTRTPTLHHLCQTGSYTLQARSVMPCLTLPCHTSIFHSVPPSRHGITSNHWTPMARPLPGLIEKANHADKRCGFFTNWEHLRDVSQPGNLVLNFCYNTSETDLSSDEVILETALSAIPRFALDFSFVYFGTLDSYGHYFGWMSDEYLTRLSVVDGLVAQLLAAFPEATFFLQSDHGGHDRTHGEDIPEDMTIPMMMKGANIRQGFEIEASVSLLDTAPTLARMLGVAGHPHWEGRCLEEIFES